MTIFQRIKLEIRAFKRLMEFINLGIEWRSHFIDSVNLSLQMQKGCNAICTICTKEWIAICPDGLEPPYDLECPECGRISGFKYQ